jgi:hypothetical protein
MRLLIGLFTAAMSVACARAVQTHATTVAPEASDGQAGKSPACIVPAPERRIVVTHALSPDDLRQISQVVGESPQTPIIRIEEQQIPGTSESPSTGADILLTVVVYGGYDQCSGFGKNSGSIVERVGGRWQLLGKQGRIVEYVH